MTITFYLLASLAAVALIVGLNLILMGRGRARVGLDSAKALLETENPGFRAADAVVGRDGRAALVEDETGAVYLVAAAGDRFVSRKLSSGSVRTLVRDGDMLTLRLRDFTFPRARLVLADADAAAAWEAHVKRALA